MVRRVYAVRRVSDYKGNSIQSNRCLFSHVGGALFIDGFKIMNEARKDTETSNTLP